jgi:hypothetical protein
VIDVAPRDLRAIREIVETAEMAVWNKDYPSARLLFFSLASEIRVRTFSLPLATYPLALREAVRLLDQKKNDEASTMLLAALNTLVVIDRVLPIPLVLAEAAVREAQDLRDKDKDRAREILRMARNELERARELGYAGKDPEYQELDDAVDDLEKQLGGEESTESTFSKLTDRVSSFFKRMTEGMTR